MAEIRIDTARVLGEVSPNIYGQFSEHLVNIIMDGLWSEMIKGRKFETPLVASGPHPIAAPWRPFADRTDRIRFRRGDAAMMRISSPHADAHHCQSIESDTDAEVGLVCPEVVINQETTYVFRGRIRKMGADRVKVALRGDDGVTSLGEAWIELRDVASSRPQVPQLMWMDEATLQEVSCEITATGSAPTGHLSITLEGPGAVHLDWVSLMPADNLDGWHRETIELLRDVPVQMVKWPGGCFADGYDWRMGIGPRDARHCYVDPAWLAWEENDVGTDEYLRFCRLTNSEPCLGVNVATESPEVAAAWVEYCNGSKDTEWGAMRAQNGSPDPHNVRYWVVGNEVYGDWERGGLAGRPDLYAEKLKRFASAMRAVDPNIIIVASSQIGEYTRGILEHAAAEVDEISIHFYPSVGSPESDDSARRHLNAASSANRHLAVMRHDIAAAGGDGRIKVAVDEWGWARDHQLGALFNAIVLNAYQRAGGLVSMGSRTCVANADGLVNRFGQRVTTTLAHELFATYNRFHRPLAVAVDVDGVATETAVAPHQALGEVPVLDVSAMHDPASGATSVFVVNRDLHNAVDADVAGSGSAHVLAGSSIASAEARFAEQPFGGGTFTFPPASVTVLDLRP